MGQWIFTRREFVSAQQCAMNSAADVFKKPYSFAHQRVQNCRLQHSWRFIKKVIPRPRIGFKCQAWYISEVFIWILVVQLAFKSLHCSLVWLFVTKMIYCTKVQLLKEGQKFELNHLLSRVNIKSKLKIKSNFVAFSESLNFILNKLPNIHTICFLSILQVRDGTILVLKTSNLQPQVTSTLV